LLQDLRDAAERFAPVDLVADLTGLPANERRAVAILVKAAGVFDALYLRQVWAGNETMLLTLLGDTSDLGRARLRYFLINSGPWSRLDNNAVFVPGAPPKSPQANFYPSGATKQDVETWMQTLPPASRGSAAGFFTTIRRGADGGFVVVPYSVEYQGELAQVTPRAMLRGWRSMRASSRRSVHTRSTRTSGSTTRPRSRRSSRSVIRQRPRSWRGLEASYRRSRTICQSTRDTATHDLARWRRFGWSIRCSHPVRLTGASRPRRSTCPTTSA
jgi:hypothetical protein